MSIEPEGGAVWSEWNCSGCGRPAVDDTLGVPGSMEPSCPYFFSIVPNYLH